MTCGLDHCVIGNRVTDTEIAASRALLKQTAAYKHCPIVDEAACLLCQRQLTATWQMCC